MRMLIDDLKGKCVHEEYIVKRLLSMGIPMVYNSECRGFVLLLSDNLPETQSIVNNMGLDLRIRYIERCVVSSQDIAKEEADRGAPEGTVVICGSMEVGRGRFGRRWYAPPGGLWFTVITRPREVEKPWLITLVGGVAVAETLRVLLGVEAGLKWPNDVVVEGKKVAGILAEGIAEGTSISYVLLGIGVNVNNELPKELTEIATTLKEVLGREIPRATLLASILRRLWSLYQELKKTPITVIRKWRDLNVTLNKYVEIKLVNGDLVRGTAVDIDNDGKLLVMTFRGLMAIDAGEVLNLRPLHD